VLLALFGALRTEETVVMVDRKHIDEENLQTDPELESRRDSLLPVSGGVMVVVTHAYGPDGESLMDPTVLFDGNASVALKIRANGQEGIVHLSPVHGDRRKSGFTAVEPGTRCALFSPSTGKPLDKLGPVDDGSGADYYALYLTPQLSKGACVMLTDIWDHYHSRVVDDNALLSYWARNHPDE
jgi:hypothetical protein